MNCAVLGNGSFGTAMAMVCAAAGHRVRQWGHDAAYTAEIARTRRNPRYLPASIELPASILIDSHAEGVLAGVDIVWLAIPTQHVRAVLANLRDCLPAGVPLVSLAKGLEQQTMLRPSQVVAEVVGPGHPVVVLGGPNHAVELAQGLPAAVVLAGDEPSVLLVQEALGRSALRPYRQRDLLGVELCGALKNVMALAAGICDGLGYGDNAKAAILARGLVEMARYGVAEGAEQSTFFGIAGVGDLAVTAFSKHGRNRAAGERLGQGETLERILASTSKVAEGVWTAPVVLANASRLGLDMPITKGVCAVLYEGLAPKDAVRALMDRGLKDELVG